MRTNALPTSSQDVSLNSPPSVRGHFLLGNVPDLRHDALKFYLKLMHEYGDVARIRLVNAPTYVVSHPDGIRQILQKNHMNYDRHAFSSEPLRLFLGNGVLLSDGALWQRQRHLIQPAFHKRHLTAMATQMTKAGDMLLKRWENRDEPLDIHKEMLHVTLCNAGMTLFSLDLTAEHNTMGQAFQGLIHELADYVYLPFPPLIVPTQRNRRIQSTLNKLRTLVHDLIRERREQKTDTSDLLSLLLACDEDGPIMSDQQVHDEMLSFLFAGHETTAGTLTWVWYELSRHPEVQHRLWEELDTVLHGEYPDVTHLPQLPYARRIIDETLRLYPPITGLPRRTLANDDICGYRIPAKSQVVMNIYGAHRHPTYWQQPETFNPDRFLPDHVSEGPRRAYFPFGAGPHVCMGNNFALMAAQILLTMIAQRYRLQLAPGQTVEPVQRLTIRPRHDIFMFLKERK